MKRIIRVTAVMALGLLATACEMGAAIGAPDCRGALRDYGQRLGMAFQLVDDMMDYGGEQSVMGKPAGSDLREGQTTFPLLAILPRLESRERRTVQAAFTGAGPDPDLVERVIELVRDRGGIEATRRVAREYADRAREALLPLPVTPARDVLDAAVDYVLGRDR